MAEPHPNVERYLRTVRAFNEGDVATALELTDEHIVYRIPGRSPIAGEFHGLGAYHEALRRVRDLSGNTLSLTPAAVFADDTFLLVYGRIRARRGDKQLDADHCVMFRFAHGKIVEGRTIPVDQYAFDEFWS